MITEANVENTVPDPNLVTLDATRIPETSFDGDPNPYLCASEAFWDWQLDVDERREPWTPENQEVIHAASSFHYTLTMARSWVTEKTSRKELWRSLMGWGWLTYENPEYEEGDPILSWQFDPYSQFRHKPEMLLTAPVESELVRVVLEESRTIRFTLKPSNQGETRFILAAVANRYGSLSKAKQGYRDHLIHKARSQNASKFN
ncbi:hypothetical protein [Adhaeretor mobilis]|uniref:Uncharacterized protein n=1 Tax=Adhaeretor mobilis TaxID=1930276 RepID=A0A517MWS1_9BACT|nr:hypothetical protein [Adhaeretor mobilis]QDS99323.1 hypothetical protein HG15A2_26450 [Adhaeretor mobilis]